MISLQETEVKRILNFFEESGRIEKTPSVSHTQGNSKNYFVFVIPVAAELDLKAAARSVGEKSVAMIHVADINKVTGYVRGGCSPVGMKKQYKTVFDESVLTQEKVYVSGGRIGTQVCCAPADLIRAARAITAKIIF